MLKSPMDLIKAAWAAFTKRWKFYVLLTFVSGLIPGLVFMIGGAIAAAVGLGSAAGGAGNAALVIAGIVLLVAYIAAIYVSIIFYAGMMLAISNEQINTVRAAYNAGKPKAKDMFILSLLLAIIVSLASLLFLIPGIYLAICYTFALWLCVLEGKTGMAALRASKDMVTGRWWAIAGRLCAFVVIVWVIVAIPQSILTAIRLPFLAGLWSAASGLVIGPVGAIFSFLLYQNAKQTKASAPTMTA